MDTTIRLVRAGGPRPGSSGLLARLNGPWHRAALLVFVAIVLAHWAEHALQALEVFVLGWPRPAALGALGLVMPWAVTSEWLHYLYALVMLAALVALRPGFRGRALLWWDVALGIQVWHHFEHALLLAQALGGTTFFGSPVPTSLVQLVAPRVELHLVYNALVSAPMAVAMLCHVQDPAPEAGGCSCPRRAAPGAGGAPW